MRGIWVRRTRRVKGGRRRDKGEAWVGHIGRSWLGIRVGEGCWVGGGRDMLVCWYACIDGHQFLRSLRAVAVSSGASHMIEGTGDFQTFFGIQGSDAQLWMDVLAFGSFVA